jgi:hypothetical protein
MPPKGVYRLKRPPSGAEYAYVHGIRSKVGQIPREKYEERGYKPPFDQLPTKAMYEKWKVRNA